MPKTAIVLFNLGGPDKPESIKPFLFNLFNDEAIIGLPQPLRYLLAKFISSRRNKIATEIYQNLGGKSPILEITTAQAEELEKSLSFKGDDYKIFIAMRYWHPMSKEVVEKIKEYNPDRIIALPLYPHFSTTTTGSSIVDFFDQAKKQKLDKPIKYVCCYPDNPSFISAHSNFIKEAIAKTVAAKYKDYRILFSAHGLPQSVIEKGDPYVFQINLTADLIINELKKSLKIKEIDSRVCYQSKVGPMKWTSPSLDMEISRAALDKKAVIIVPIAFVSDHSETLVELDIEYKELAEQKGVPFYMRVPALNSDSNFIESLSEICQKVIENDSTCHSGQSHARICPKNFSQCPNFNDIIEKQ